MTIPATSTTTTSNSKKPSIGSRIRNSLRRASVLKQNKKSSNTHTGAASEEKIIKTHTEIEDDRSSNHSHHEKHQFRSTFRSTMTSTTCDTCPDDVDEPSAFEKEEDSFKSFLDNATGVEDNVSTSEEPMIRQSLVAQSSMLDTDSSAVSCRASSTVDASADSSTGQRRSRRRYQRRCSVTKYSFEEPTKYSSDGALSSQREEPNASLYGRARYAQTLQCQ